jgi:hypothetical protein
MVATAVAWTEKGVFLGGMEERKSFEEQMVMSRRE